MSMELIEHIEVGSGGAASISFVSVGDIPSDYTDLYIVISARSDDTTYVDDGITLQFNSDATTYTARNLFGTGSSVSSHTQLGYAGSQSTDLATASTFGNSSIYIPNYRSSAAKSFSADGVAENNGTAAFQVISAGLWDGTVPITSIQLTPKNGANFKQFTSATLYGIRKYDTTGSPKATGGIISYDSVNNYWVHTFTASGTFTPTENLTAEYLVIAGGGAGGSQGGGGGAGGYRCAVSGESSGGGASAESALSLTGSTGYTVTIGAGGSGNADRTITGGSGNNSVFGSITSTGGGGGGARLAQAPTGGSGGGSNGNYGTPGSGTANQGYSGGSGGTGIESSGGGGGAGAVGGNGASNEAGDGGTGVSSSITGFSVTRGGGGGGSTSDSASGFGGDGGAGGGGDGNANYSGNGSPGVANTGGGGGGCGFSYTSGNGGSGIVIVRYAA